MKPPVLVIAAGASAHAIRAALADDFSPTITDDVERGRALASTGGFLAVGAVAPLDLEGAVSIDPAGKPAAIVAVVHAAIAASSVAHRELARVDKVGAVPYDEYVELARYALTRRYLLALLSRHSGSVTEAARGAGMERESLHRLLRRHHVIADDFRER
jgi:DNA-binding NtrC family response regulator